VLGTENDVYEFADSLTQRVPDGFILTESANRAQALEPGSIARIYHDPTVNVDESDPSNLMAKSGKGRAVVLLYVPNVIDGVAAAYLDADEFAAYESEKNPDKLVHQIGFLTMWMNPAESDHKVEHFIVLTKGKHVVMYAKKQGTWRMGACEIGDMETLGNALGEGKKGINVAAERVSRYLALGSRLKKTYSE